MAAHALLSASSSHRWLNCPPSARLEAQYEEDASVYAEEGTLAHSLAELELQRRLLGLDVGPYSAALADIQSNPLYSPEMWQAAEVYRDLIASEVDRLQMDHSVALYTEQRLDFSSWVPEGFGTADCMVCAPHEFVVFDFKYGRGVPVSAENNPQLKLYALGVLSSQSLVWGENPVTCYIVQPRLDSISSVKYSYSELMDWGRAIKPLAEMAYNGDGTLAIGDWCRFCKHRRNCERQKEEALSVVALPSPKELSPEALAEILAKAPAITEYLKDLEAWALERVRDNGERIPGFKLVAGRSIRKYTDPEAIATVLKAAGFGSEIYKKPELLGLGDMERLLSKARFKELLSDFIVKPEGAPTLVPESDKRPEINTNSALEAFSEVK